MKISVTCACYVLHLIIFLLSSMLFMLVATNHIITESQDKAEENLKNLSQTDEKPFLTETSVTIQDVEIEKGQNKDVDTNPLGEQVVNENVAEIHSSFAERLSASEADDSGSSFPANDTLSEIKNVPAPDELSETSQAVVFTLVDSASAELQQRALSDNPAPGENLSVPTSFAEDEAKNLTAEDIAEVAYVIRAEPKRVEPQQLEGEAKNDSAGAGAEKQDDAGVEGGGDNVGQELEQTPTEDIPSFNEWRQKLLAEDEQKKKVQNGTLPPVGNQGRQPGTSKVHSKNYASPDCGAKIVATNPEAASASNVLSPSRDEYVLNPCTSRIWFVVELCEAIQAKKIDLANFELFSSSPREFSVFVSDRFPTRDWHNVGHFVAEDERTIQSFNLHPHLFGKFIKVELHSHFGSEHFCPISLFRVYGTSEFEVLKTVDEVLETEPAAIGEGSLDEDDDEPLDFDSGDPPKNLFGSARDAVLSIMRKAAEVLVKGSDVQNSTTLAPTATLEEPIPVFTKVENCKSPRHIVVCDNCSDPLFGDVYRLLSCDYIHLDSLMKTDFVSRTIRDTQICEGYGLDFTSRRIGAPFPLRLGQSDPVAYMAALFPPSYIAALCNTLAIIEKRVAINVSSEDSTETVISVTELPDTKSPFEGEFENILKPVVTCTTTPTQTNTICSTPVVAAVNVHLGHTDLDISSKIKPTKTLTVAPEVERDESLTVVPSQAPDEMMLERPPRQSEQNLEIPPLPEKNETLSDLLDLGGNGDSLEQSTEALEHFSLDRLLSELKDLEREVVDTPTVTTTLPPNIQPSQQVHKESVFMRLANKIKALERNMSLSSQYLEELSRRYKKQVEEMQKLFNRTMAAINDESRKAEDRQLKQAEELEFLRTEVATLSSLLAERNTWFRVLWDIIQSLILIVAIGIMIHYGRQLQPHHNTSNNYLQPKLLVKRSAKVSDKRRRSVEGVSGHETRKIRKRRPSEEALVSGSYQELLILDNGRSEVDGGVRTILKAENKRRRRKKKDSVPFLNYVAKVNEESSVSLDSTVTVNSEAKDLPFEKGGSVLGKSASTEDSSAESVSQHFHNSVDWRETKTGSRSSPQVDNNPRENGTNENPPAVRPNGIPTRQVSSPGFMKTALSSRIGRRASTESQQAKLKSDNWEWYSSRHSATSVQSVSGQSDSERTSNSGSSEIVRKKPSAIGLKKIVKKFF